MGGGSASVRKAVSAKKEPASEPSQDAAGVALKDAPAYSPNLITLSAPLSSAAESIRVMRTHILAQHIQIGRRALAICAPSLGVGCSFVAANLAVALAQIGLKTLLVDADLRAPRIEEFIRPVMRPPGLVACLRAPASDIGDAIENDVLPNLSVFYAGEAASNTQELLARDWFEDVMKYCLREYDITIVDTPPANTSADARRIAHVVGYALIVARRNVTLVDDVRTLAEQFIDDHVKVVGTLMNAD
jgi:protein-tyrosine kinase